MPEVEIPIEQPHSCKISINAAGKFSGEVKCYAATSDIAVADAKDKANELKEYLDRKNKAGTK